MTNLARLSHLGLFKETTQGTPGTPTVFLPVMKDSFKPEDKIPDIVDESLRANSAVVQDIYGGPSESECAFSGMAYPDSIGHLLRMLGLVDTTSAGTGGRTIHTMKATAAQPPTYSMVDFDGFAARAFAGQMLSELTLKAEPASGAVTYDAKTAGWPSTAVSTPTPSYGTVAPFLGWQLTWSTAGGAAPKVLSTELSFKRDVEVIHGADGLQGPTETFADGLDFSGKFKTIFDSAVDRDRFLAYSKQAIVGTLSVPGASGAILAITSTEAVFTKAAVDRAGKYHTLDVEMRGKYTAADAGPGFAVLTNSVAAAY